LDNNYNKMNDGNNKSVWIMILKYVVEVIPLNWNT
jgi:hypothetical protein